MNSSLDRFLRRVGLVRRAKTAPGPGGSSIAVGAFLLLVPIALAFAVHRLGTDPARARARGEAGAEAPPPAKGDPAKGGQAAPAASGLEALLPSGADLPKGLTPSTRKLYKPNTLADRIDGREDIFLLYGYQECLVAELKHAAPAADLEAWIFRMGDPLRAFGIYSADADSAQAEAGTAGERGCKVSPSVYFFRGPYYVKCQYVANAADKDKPALLAAATALAEGIDKRIGDAPPLAPPVFSQFPGGFVRGTVKFLPKDELDRDFLKDFFSAQYPEERPGGEKARMEILFEPAADAAAASALVGKFRDYYKAAGKVTRDEAGVLEGEDAEGLGFEVRASGRFLLAASLFKDRAAARGRLDALAKSLEGR